MCFALSCRLFCFSERVNHTPRVKVTQSDASDSQLHSRLAHLRVGTPIFCSIHRHGNEIRFVGQNLVHKLCHISSWSKFHKLANTFVIHSANLGSEAHRAGHVLNQHICCLALIVWVQVTCNIAKNLHSLICTLKTSPTNLLCKLCGGRFHVRSVKSIANTQFHHFKTRFGEPVALSSNASHITRQNYLCR